LEGGEKGLQELAKKLMVSKSRRRGKQKEDSTLGEKGTKVPSRIAGIVKKGYTLPSTKPCSFLESANCNLGTSIRGAGPRGKKKKRVTEAILGVVDVYGGTDLAEVKMPKLKGEFGERVDWS